MARTDTHPEIEIKNSFTRKEEPLLANEISQLTKKEEHLSFRTPKEIAKEMRNKNVVCLFEKNELTTFLFATPRGKKTIELHCLYTKPHARHKGHAHKIMNHILTDKTHTFFAAIFQPQIADFLTTLGFEEQSIRTLTWREKLSFVAPRFAPHRLKEVVRHRQKNPLRFFFKMN